MGSNKTRQCAPFHGNGLEQGQAMYAVPWQWAQTKPGNVRRSMAMGSNKARQCTPFHGNGLKQNQALYTVPWQWPLKKNRQCAPFHGNGLEQNCQEIADSKIFHMIATHDPFAPKARKEFFFKNPIPKRCSESANSLCKTLQNIEFFGFGQNF